MFFCININNSVSQPPHCTRDAAVKRSNSAGGENWSPWLSHTQRMNNEHTLFSHWAGSAQRTMNPSLLSRTMSDNDHIHQRWERSPALTYMSTKTAQIKHFRRRCSRRWSAVRAQPRKLPFSCCFVYTLCEKKEATCCTCAVPAGHLSHEVKCGFAFCSEEEEEKKLHMLFLSKQHLVKLFKGVHHSIIGKKIMCIFRDCAAGIQHFGLCLSIQHALYSRFPVWA